MEMGRRAKGVGKKLLIHYVQVQIPHEEGEQTSTNTK